MDTVRKLTAEGRLAEATALIQSLHSVPQTIHAGWPAAAAHEAPTPATASETVHSGRFEWRSFSNGAGTLRYKVYIPAAAASESLPVVVMLHGCKQTPEDFALGTAMNLVADERSFIVVYPEQTGRANASRCWNWFQAKDQERDRGEPSLLAGLTRQVCAEFRADAANVHIAGLSAGGAAAAVVANLYPEQFASVGVHSGLAYKAATDLPSALSAMRSGGKTFAAGARVPTIVFHGDRDATVNVANATALSQQVLEGVDTRISVEQGVAQGLAYTRTIHSVASGASLLETWIVHGGGHAWYGGNRSGSYTAPGPDATREMARFFLEHRRPQR